MLVKLLALLHALAGSSIDRASSSVAQPAYTLAQRSGGVFRPSLAPVVGAVAVRAPG